MDIETLKNRVYVTRKARINAAERLKNTGNFVKFLNIYYSIWLVAFSIYSVIDSTTKLSIILTISSVALTISVMFLSTKRFDERASAFKANYIALDLIHLELCNIPSDDATKLPELIQQYADLQKNCENHAPYDYYKAKRSIVPNEKENGEVLSKKQNFAYIFRTILNWTFVFFFIILPFLMKYFANIIEWVIKV